MKEINTELEIMASSERVWEALTDFPNFGKWNPVITKINGEAKVKTRLEIHLRTRTGKSRIYRPIITKIEPNHELRWFGKSLFPGILNGERIFTINPLGEKRVRFFHRQIFTGIGAYLAGDRLERDIKHTLNQMNLALQKHVEQHSLR